MKIHSCQGIKKARNIFQAYCVAPRVGLEPTTLRLTAACSTIELSRNHIIKKLITADELYLNISPFFPKVKIGIQDSVR